MRDDWILDLLADLRSFAAANQLPRLAEQLDDTAIIALAELSERQGTAHRPHDKTEATGTDLGRVGSG